MYASEQRLALRGGRGYNEDNLIDYDVLDYQVDSSYVPERAWLEGRTSMRVRVRAFALATLTLRLEEPLAVSAVRSNLHGRLLAIRVRGQNSLLVSLPRPLYRDDVLTLDVAYAGRVEAPPPLLRL